MIPKRKSQLSNNYQRVISKVPRDKLVAVSKYHTFEDVQVLYELGHRDFGESRVQDLKEKALLAKQSGLDEIHWHFIGHLQSKKTKELFSIENLYALHSVDSIKLAEQVLTRAHLLTQPLHLFIQVNSSGESEKSGTNNFTQTEEVFQTLFQKNESLLIEGLMTIGKVRTDQFEKDAKACFALLSDYKHQLEKKYNHSLKLSMGMSADYQWALEYGSDFVRVGSAIFSES